MSQELQAKKIILADGVEFKIGMTLHRASNLGPKQEKTSHETHYIVDGDLCRYSQNGFRVPGCYISENWFSTRNAALDELIDRYDRQIENLKEQRDRLEGMKQ